jgi:hypothetical protein
VKRRPRTAREQGTRPRLSILLIMHIASWTSLSSAQLIVLQSDLYTHESYHPLVLGRGDVPNSVVLPLTTRFMVIQPSLAVFDGFQHC